MTTEKSTVTYREEHIQELFRILGKMPTKGINLGEDQPSDAWTTDQHWVFLVGE